jgi:hypothetical protein
MRAQRHVQYCSTIGKNRSNADAATRSVEDIHREPMVDVENKRGCYVET